MLYVRTRCGLRGVVTIISILNELLHLDLNEPCFNSIENWVKKGGFSIYNPLNGVTPFVLLLPLYARLSNKKKCVNFDFKQSLESVFMSDIADWKKEKLIENQVSMRTKKLKAA